LVGKEHISPEYKSFTKTYEIDWLHEGNFIENQWLKDNYSIRQLPDWPYGVNSDLTLDFGKFFHLVGYIFPIEIISLDKSRKVVLLLFSTIKDYYDNYFQNWERTLKNILKNFTLLAIELGSNDNPLDFFNKITHEVSNNEAYLTVQKVDRSTLLDTNLCVKLDKIGNKKIIGMVLLAFYRAIKPWKDLETAEIDIEKDPNDDIAWYNKGTVVMNLERYEEASVAFKRVIRK